MTISEKAKKIIRRIFRITITTILVILGIILLILLLIQTGPVQNYGRGKIEAYLEKKLHTKVRIGKLYIDFPSRVVLKNIYLEDQRKDTLIYGEKIEVDISMFRLLHKEVRLNNLELDHVTLKVKRLMPDSVFNFQFIADAFSSPEKKPAKKDTSGSFQFVIGTIQLHQIHATYMDDATGNDMYLSLGDFKARLKTFDPAHQSYAIPEISLSDISGRVKQYHPILIFQHLADTVSEHNKHAEPVHLALGVIDLTRINLDYRNDLQNMDAAIRLGQFHTKVDSIDLATMHLKLNQVTLDSTTASLKFGKLVSRENKKIASVKDTVVNAAIWSVDVTSFRIDSTQIQYDDDNKPTIKKGIDYNHLQLKQLQIHTGNLHADPSNYRALISTISFNEKSGFVLKKISTDLNYGAKGISLKNLVIQTANSDIKNQTSIQYKSLDDLKKNPGDIATSLEFDRARIAVKDILIFVPSLEGPLNDNQKAVLILNGSVTGQLKNLRVQNLEIAGVGNTMLAASGTIKGLPDSKKAFYDITLTKLKTSKKDILRFIPAKSFPENIRIPEHIAANGIFRGSVTSFFVQLHTVTSNGDADIHGTLNLNQKTYDLIADTRSVDLGYILKQDSLLGKITLHATAKGSGFDPKKMNSDFHVYLGEAEIKSYTYKGLQLDAKLNNGNGRIHSSMTDPNLSYQLNAETNFTEKYPALKMKFQLDTLNAQALHLMDSLDLHGVVDADFKSTNPDSLQGHLALSDLSATSGSIKIHTDSIFLLAQHTDSGQLMRLYSEAADVNWRGQYKLTQVSESFRRFINNYYKISVPAHDSTVPEKWQMDLVLRPSPIVLALMPSLAGTDSLTGHIQFNSAQKNLNLLLHADKIQINQQVIHQFTLATDSKDSALTYNISVANAGQPGFQLYRSDIYGSLSHNRLLTTIEIKDKKAKNKYVLSGALSQVNNGLKFVFNPDSLLLDYEAWQMPADNFIRYDTSGLLVRNFKLARQGESIVMNSNGETTRSPLDISFTNFKIKTITEFAEQDSLLLDGTINGKAEVKNILSKPLFTSDLRIDTLAYQKDTVGNLTIQVNNEQLNAFTAHIALKGRENDLQMDGKYFSGEGKMDMNVILNQLNLATLKGVAVSQVKNMQGYLKGNLHASGNLTTPVLKGVLHFDNAVITPVITGEPLKLSNDKINFDEGGFDFDNFLLLDSAGSKATLDGNVFTKDYKNYQFDISFSAQNFRAVNAAKEPNRMFYGKLNLNAAVDVTGDMNLPKVTCNLRVNKNTDFYVILPSENPEVVDRNGVVVFTSKTKKVDSTQLKNFLDSLASNTSLKGMDLSATIETDSSAQFTLIIDERNGDALSMRGRAELVGGIDKSGKTSLTGNYELVNGAYNLTLSVLHRKFDIQRGSVITWTGDPNTANIDITAIYSVNTPPIDLVQSQLSGQTDQNRFKTRLPFQVKLNMTGELLKPIIKFDIALPDNLLALWPEVDTKLIQIRTDEAEVNKQVFALLLLGRFIQENPFQSAGAGTDAGTIAKQSASKLLSDQLNQLAGSLVKGVDVNFDLNSNQDYSSGSATNQTDLNIKVSKNLFDDRIRVTVGSDFQLEQTNPGQNASNIAGDVSVDYKLTKDGRYKIRVYRNDQYQTVVQGQVVETGLSFILTFDYNSFRELFQNKKESIVTPHKPHKKVTTSDSKQTTSANTPAK